MQAGKNNIKLMQIWITKVVSQIFVMEFRILSQV